MNHYATNQYTARAGRHFWFAKELKRRGYDVSVFCATTFLESEEEIDTNGNIFTVKKTADIPFIFVKTVVSRGNGIDRLKNMALFYRNLFPTTECYAKKMELLI